MIDLTTLSPLTYTGFACIAIALIFFLLKESDSTQKYQKSFVPDSRAIDYLKTQRRNISELRQLSQYVDITPNTEDSELFIWISHHLDSKAQDQRLMTRVENNMFVLLERPSRLYEPIPKSPSYVPTLLTTIGVLFTFIGVSKGLYGLEAQTSSNDLTLLAEEIMPLLGGLSLTA